MVDGAGEKILRGAGVSIEDVPLPTSFAEWVHRGLVEIERRALARLSDDYECLFFDQQFDCSRAPNMPFGRLCD